MIFTLDDAWTFLGDWVNEGTCDTTLITERVNECTRVLLNAKNWKLTTRKVRFCTENTCLTCPREIEKVLHITIDNVPKMAFGMAYQFLEGGPGRIDSLTSVTSKDLVDLGRWHPTFFDIGDDARQIVAFSTEGADVGELLTIQGRVQYNVPAFMNTAPGEQVAIQRWAGGVEGSLPGSLSMQSHATTNEFRTIAAVSKPVTAGYVTLYAVDFDALFAGDVDSATGAFHFLGKYHPDETQPAYRRYRIVNHNLTDGECIDAIVKLAYVPAKHATDVLLIQSLEALKAMSQATNHYNRAELQTGAILESQARSRLFEATQEATQHDNTIQVEDDFGLGDVEGVT